MQNLKLYFFYFRESFRLISPIQEPISNLALLQILRSALHFFKIPFILLYSLFVLTHYSSMNQLYWTYFGISAFVLIFLSSFLSKRFGLMLLVAYYNFYEVGKRLGLKELFQASKEYVLAKKGFIKEMAKVPGHQREFYGTMRFYDVIFSRSTTNINQTPIEILSQYENIQSLQKSNQSIHFTISWIVIFTVTMIHLLPVKMVSGLHVLNVEQLTITNSIGVCVFLSLVIGVVEYVHNGFIKHNKLKYILYANAQNYDACNNIFSRVQEHYRETKIAISYKLLEDYKIEIIFLACLFLITLLLSWIFSSLAYTCGTLVVLLYPIIIRKLSRSRLFLGLRLVKAGSNKSFGLAHFLVYVHYLLNFILFWIASLYFVLGLPTLNIMFLSMLDQLIASQPWLEGLMGVQVTPVISLIYFVMSLALLAQLKRTGHSSKSKLFEIVSVYLMNTIFIYLVVMNYINGIHYCLVSMVFFQLSLLKVVQRGLNK